MLLELNLRFPDPEHVIVTFEQRASASLPFVNPFTAKDHADLRWYVETYAAHSLGDPDDQDAARVREHLPEWGKALFEAVFGDAEAIRMFHQFQDKRAERLLTISSEHPDILGLPWELLRDPTGAENYLFLESWPISIRRRFSGATGGRGSYFPEPKDRLHLLFVVCRPEGSGFLDPRADPGAVMDALEAEAPGRVTTEFLRPPTFAGLLRRLKDKRLPQVDIIHFDGHGVFDSHGGIVERMEEKKAGFRGPREELMRGGEAVSATKSPPNTGYLLFEDGDHKIDLVSAEKLGDNLNRAELSLVILSACQSAAMGKADDGGDGTVKARPMGSVAARLTATGIPSVLAMTHSVLVPTTRKLFGSFYGALARHEGIGEALDHARQELRNDPFKYDVQRGAKRVKLELEDWFLPALYQPEQDVVLLKAGAAAPAAVKKVRVTNLKEALPGGFHGRRWELWEIERWFTDGTRRISVTGFGGQGKTALAQEAGRWLLRTGMFEAVVFVDYFKDRSADAVRAAMNELGVVLDKTFTSEDEATAALTETPVLLILDNLEILTAESRQALLTAAVAWSRAGRSRLLLTTRQPDAKHADYGNEGTLEHRALALRGLGRKERPDDALEWFAALQKLPPLPVLEPPSREALTELFAQVEFHPLSIRVLASQLKTRSVGSVGKGLGALLGSAEVQEHKNKDDDTPAGLLASVIFSLKQLDEASQKLVNRLGVFQGGAFEDDLVTVTGLGEVDQRRPLLTFLAAVESGDVRAVLALMGQEVPKGEEIPAGAVVTVGAQLPAIAEKIRAAIDKLPVAADDGWSDLRRQLEMAGLLEPEHVPGVGAPYLRFHPTLGPLLASRLGMEERVALAAAHRKRYYGLANFIYKFDYKNPHEARAIARRELPNLLQACHAAFDAGDPNAADFADSLNRFLTAFGLRQESESLLQKARTLTLDTDSEGWFLAQTAHGDQLFGSGQVQAARELFEQVLLKLGESVRYERAVTLARIGRCFESGGRPDLAVKQLHAAIRVLDALEPTAESKHQRGAFLTDLGDSLADLGDFAEARKVYAQSLDILRESKGGAREEGVVLGQLGTLAMREGNLQEAVERFQEALKLFQRLHEPTSEAIAWHQLGMAFRKTGQWDEAERHYRVAAQIEEKMGNFVSAAQTWNSLAIVSEQAGKPKAAEEWYRKSLSHLKAAGQRALALSNLADLIYRQPGRLTEAYALAREALDIKKLLDPGATTIWATYGILAKITEVQAQQARDTAERTALEGESRACRLAARAARRAYPGTRMELSRYGPMILAVVFACLGDEDARIVMGQHQSSMREAGGSWEAFANVLDRLFAGERDPGQLCADQSLDAAIIIEYILEGIANPESIADFMSDNDPSSTEAQA